MPTSAKGLVNIALDSSSYGAPQGNIIGFQSAASATLTSLTQPSVPSRLVVNFIQLITPSNNGQLVLTGTDQNGNSITETVSNIANTVPSQDYQTATFYYATTNIFKTLTSAVTTNITSGSIVANAVKGATANPLPSILKTKPNYNTYSPDESRGVLDRDFYSMQLEKSVSIDSIEQVLYNSSSLWWPYMTTTSSPTITTTPSTPTVLLAATAVSGSPLSLSTQSSFPGMSLQYVVTGSSTSGTIVVTGTDAYGRPLVDTIACTGNGTFYSSAMAVFSAVGATSIVTTGLTGGSLAVNGIFYWTYTFLPGDNVYSAALEWFTGSSSFTFPWTMLTESTLELDPKKPVMVTAKGFAQEQHMIGQKSNQPTTTRVASLSQPYADMPYAGWQTGLNVGSLAGGPGANDNGGFDAISVKYNFKHSAEPGYTLSNSQTFNRILRDRRELEIDIKIDQKDGKQWDRWRRNDIQYLSFFLFGGVSGNISSPSWSIVVPFQFMEYVPSSVPGDHRSTADIKLKGVYDPVLGGMWQHTIQTYCPPNYAIG